MSKVNGHGGCAVIDGTPPVRLDVAEYELDVESIVDDVTDSGSGGSAEGLPCLTKVNSVTMSMPEDSVSYAEALGLTVGAVGTIWLRRGSLNQYDKITNAIFKGLKKVNDNMGKARRQMLTFEYGSYSHNVTPPSGFGD